MRGRRPRPRLLNRSSFVLFKRLYVLGQFKIQVTMRWEERLHESALPSFSSPHCEGQGHCALAQQG
jgi:hypothetical protein